MSPILDRIVWTGHGAKRHNSQVYKTLRQVYHGQTEGSWASSGSSSSSWKECEFSSFSLDQLTGADYLAHSAGDGWGPAHPSLVECSGPDPCGRVRAVTRPC
ncbi:hypothetical protein F2Q69_00015402 [Brassica cretica]|uniref:Uncharacterized protein n=1 Tax=Brassica cretica TaxID=69181 RepID=A0A8S9R5I4_BRACR|nr:hypothetical protein F2Q69_00015402 [Brassica cretica]